MRRLVKCLLYKNGDLSASPACIYLIDPILDISGPLLGLHGNLLHRKKDISKYAFCKSPL